MKNEGKDKCNSKLYKINFPNIKTKAECKENYTPFRSKTSCIIITTIPTNHFYCSIYVAS